MLKKAIITTLCYCLLLLSSVNAQTRIIVVEDDGVDPDPLTMDDNLNAIFETPTVQLANLVGIDLSRSSSAQLPPGTEPLFLKFELGSYSTLIPMLAFNYSEHINGYPVYSLIEVNFTVNMGEVCSSPAGGLTSFNYTFSLARADGTPYPIHDTQYSNPDGIFSCKVFTITCPDCPTNKECKQVSPGFGVSPSFGNLGPGSGPGPEGPESPNDPYTVFKGHVNCPGSLFFSHSGNGGAPQNGKTAVTPNPFTKQFDLQYRLGAEALVHVTIFNAQGQIMHQSQQQQSADIHRQTFDASQWANGLYYCKIQAGKESQMLKMVKWN